MISASLLKEWGEAALSGEPGRTAVLLPTRNRRKELRICLKTLLLQSRRDWDLVLVEDGSTAAEIMEIFGPELAAAGHHVRMFKGPSTGPAGASQAGFEVIGHSLVLRLDDDLRPEPDFLERLRKIIDGDARIAAVAGHYPNPDAIREHGLPDENGVKMLRLFGGRILLMEHGYEPIQRQTLPPGAEEPPYEVDHFYSAYLARREAIQAAGGFAVDYEGPGIREETDLTLRLRMAGNRLVVDPRAVAWHHHGPSGGTRSFQPEERKAMEAANKKAFDEKMTRWRSEGRAPFVVDMRP